MRWCMFVFGELTFTDLLWSPRLVGPQEVLLETRRSLEVRHTNKHIPELQEAFCSVERRLFRFFFSTSNVPVVALKSLMCIQKVLFFFLLLSLGFSNLHPPLSCKHHMASGG